MKKRFSSTSVRSIVTQKTLAIPIGSICIWEMLRLTALQQGSCLNHLDKNVKQIGVGNSFTSPTKSEYRSLSKTV